MEDEVIAAKDVLGPTDEQARQPAAVILELPVEEPPASFEEAMDYVFEKNSELYGRLA